jgi:hypothetical protein
MATAAPPIPDLRVADPALRPVADRVLAGERLTADDVVALYGSHDLLTIGQLGDWANRQKHGDRVYFCSNQHINPTNVCILRNTCVFCSFARMPKEDGAYTRTLDEVLAEAAQAKAAPTREFHIVGGLHPKLPLSYYTDIIRALRAAYPGVHVKALTAVEIAHLARIERSSPACPAAVPRCSVPRCAPRSLTTSCAARSGSRSTAKRTTWGSRPTAPCSTGTWRRHRTRPSTSGCSATSRTRPAVS